MEGSISISPIRSHAHLQKCPRFNFLIAIKEKDTSSSRRYIATLRTKFDRKHLWPNKEYEKYAEAPWILKNKELYQLKNGICSIRTPTGYGSSLSKAFTFDGHITRFKTHDFHHLTFICKNN